MHPNVKRLAGWLVLTCLATAAAAQDWPQWRGPGRDGHAAGFAAPDVWPEKLALRWRREVGAGYSSPVVAGGKVFVHSRDGEEEVVTCLALADGAALWSARYPAPYKKNSYALKHGKGPNSTPAVADGRLYTLGISGILSCFDAATGRLLWRHDASAQVNTTKLFCGTSASPIVDRGKVIAHLGDDRAGELAAFDAAGGEKLWAWTGAGPGYASPVVAEIAGTRQVVTLTERSVVGLETGSGRLLWQLGFTDEWNENIVTPIIHGDVLIVAGVRRGTLARRIRRTGDGWALEEVWTLADLPQYMSSPVRDGEVLYGFSSRQKGQLFALDLRRGELRWTSAGRQGHNAALLAAGPDHLAILTESAELSFVRRTAAALSEPVEPVARYQVAESATWAHPVLWRGNVLVKAASAVSLWSLGPPAPENR